MENEKQLLNRYYDDQRTADKIRQNCHRELVGGLWEELGLLQIEYLKKQGLQPHMNLLDVGCGCFRGGVRFIQYLDPGNYFGIDISDELMNAGYTREILPKGLGRRMPRSNMLATADFDMAQFGVDFDFFIAQSVFTHLPLNHLMLCLDKAEAVSKSGSRFFATLFVCEDRAQWASRLTHNSGVSTYPDRDPYHYHTDQVALATKGTRWTLDFVKDWMHPRGQMMAGFSRRH